VVLFQEEGQKGWMVLHVLEEPSIRYVSVRGQGEKQEKKKEKKTKKTP
jgi:hypothetical protein